MNRNTARLAQFGFSLAGLVFLGSVLAGHAAKPHGVPVPTDWSHRHLIFTRPRSPEQAARLAQDPRYLQQWNRMSQRLRYPVAVEAAVVAAATSPGNKKMHRDWAEDMGTGASVTAGNYPGKFSFNNTQANCSSATTPDYVVYSTGLLSSGSQASIVAYDNLYSGCTGTVPTAYWGYDTAGQVLTSPIISADGTQVAFAQTDGVGHGSLVLLKWAAGTGSAGAPVGLTSTAAASYPTCTAPCMTVLDLRDRGGAQTNDTTSSVFYDFSSDTAWVGDAVGYVHKFNPVFKGVPAESRPPGVWPALMPGNSPLTSVVHDRTSGNLFVGDQSGFLYRVNSTTAAVTASGQLDFGAGIVEGPVVDVTSELVYVFASSDGSAGCAGGADCAGVYQLSASFAAGTTGAEVTLGTSTVGGTTTPNPAYIGDFDNSYINSANATGNLYACGNTGADPTLYQVPIVAGATPVTGLPLTLTFLASTGQTPACSPVTDAYNPNATGGPTERLFVSVQGFGISKACSGGGCIINFLDTPWQGNNTYSVGQQILDSKGRIETVIVAGTTAAGPPLWGNSANTEKTDGTVTWLNQGVLQASTLGPWQASHAYLAGNRFLDSNGNIEVAHVAGTSGSGSAPSFGTTAGGLTPDGTGALVWINAGPTPTFALPVTGGASGAIIDNVVGSGTLGGASQVYFSTLSNQPCGTTGTGGCAVQASQPALQ